MPLYQVLDGLTTSNLQGLPDPSAILPFIGLYSVIHLKSTRLQRLTHCTPFFPPLSVLHNGQWENAPTGTASTAPNVARIFDPLAVNSSAQHPSPSLMPLHPDHPDYSHKRYWRLPKTTLSGILSAVVWRVTALPFNDDDESGLVGILHALLVFRAFDIRAGLGGDAGRGSGEGRSSEDEGRDRGRGTRQKSS